MKKFLLLFFLLSSFVSFAGKPTKADQELVVNAALNLIPIQQENHITANGFAELVVLLNYVIEEKLDLTFFERPVVFLTEKEIKDQGITSYVEFLSTDFSDEDLCNVGYRYSVNGKVVSNQNFRLETIEGQWKNVEATDFLINN